MLILFNWSCNSFNYDENLNFLKIKKKEIVSCFLSFFFLSFFFWWHVKVPRPGIEPTSQLYQNHSSWQCQILNPCSHQWTLCLVFFRVSISDIISEFQILKHESIFAYLLYFFKKAFIFLKKLYVAYFEFVVLNFFQTFIYIIYCMKMGGIIYVFSFSKPAPSHYYFVR